MSRKTFSKGRRKIGDESQSPYLLCCTWQGYEKTIVYVMVKFFPWFKFCFLSFLGIVMYGNEFETI